MSEVWISSLNDWAALWSAGMWRSCLQGGLALGAARFLCSRFPRMPAAVRCWLWRLAYLKLLVALLWAIPITLPILPSTSSRSARASFNRMEVHAMLPAGPPAVSGRPAAPATSATFATSPSASTRQLTTASVLMIVWMFGAGTCALGFVRRNVAAARLRRRCSRLHDEALVSSWRELCDRFRVDRPPTLVIVEAETGPLLLGGWHPVVILPRTAAMAGPRAEFAMILAHELAHHRRHDLLWNWLPALAHTLFFFHPLVWVGNRQWRLAQEIATDEMAIHYTGCTPEEYGSLLVTVAARRTYAHATPAAVGVLESPDTLKERLRAMQFTGPMSRRTRIRAIFCLCVLVLVGVVPWHVAAQAVRTRADAPLSRAFQPGPSALSQSEAALSSPVETVRSFVSAMNHADLKGAAAFVLGGRPEKASEAAWIAQAIREEMWTYTAVDLHADVSGDTALVHATTDLHRNGRVVCVLIGSKHESIRLRRIDGMWKIVPEEQTRKNADGYGTLNAYAMMLARDEAAVQRLNMAKRGARKQIR